MHLLLIHQAFTSPQSAGGTRHYELARRLVERGHQVTVVASDLCYQTGEREAGCKGLVTEQDLDGIRVLRAYTFPSLHKSYLWRVVSFLSFMLTSVWASLRAGRVDLVMATSPPIFQSLSTWLVAILRWRPMLLEIRDLWPEFAIDIGLLKNPLLIAAARTLEGFLYWRADHLLVNSPAYRDYLLEKGIAADKISFIPNGVDPAMFESCAASVARDSAFRTEFQLEDKFVVLYAGALGMANDIDTILQAAERLKHNPRIHFVLAGDGKDRARLTDMTRQLELTNVTFSGSRPKTEMPEVLAATDICVATLKDIPMFRTTYPNKIFDYLSAGRPVVLAIDGVIRDVVEAARAGIFVPPGNPQALAEAVEYLEQHPDEAREMGRSGREYVNLHFNREEHAGELRNLVDRLATRRRAA